MYMAIGLTFLFLKKSNCGGKTYLSFIFSAISMTLSSVFDGNRSFTLESPPDINSSSALEYVCVVGNWKKDFLETFCETSF